MVPNYDIMVQKISRLSYGKWGMSSASKTSTHAHFMSKFVPYVQDLVKLSMECYAFKCTADYFRKIKFDKIAKGLIPLYTILAFAQNKLYSIDCSRNVEFV